MVSNQLKKLTRGWYVCVGLAHDWLDPNKYNINIIIKKNTGKNIPFNGGDATGGVDGVEEKGWSFG